MTRPTSKLSDSAQEKGTNIQVVVRCRDAPAKASVGNSAVVVAPAFGLDVHTRNLSSPDMQRHQYDGVFGPQASQEQVYDKVARPILEEVMQGYSCTIFAYGQTGTGKTYTMEGELEPSSSETSNGGGVRRETLSCSRISTKAGLIPRTLHNLFYLLDKQSADYKVHVSYVELYNEELRDLLSSGNFGNGAGLKLLDPGQDKSVVIHGLEEKRVVSAQAAVELLQGGARRRQVAATRCNEESSRSHAIFTIRVEILERDMTASGQVIQKLGKLNLVDLAGSENVGRSGADVRETSSINKSLLALGQVITAVSKRSVHVPYRDSKLTQMLRDSLGGHTQACMIATINSSAHSISETMKTLKYATHARGIANKPTVTKNVVRADIVNSMQAEIDKLRLDLQAARDRQGFHMTRDTYESLTEGAAQAQAKAEEWKQRVDLLETGLDKARADTETMDKRIDQLEHDKAAAAEALRESQAQQQQLAELLRAESLFTRAHAHHEQEIGMAARQLRSDLAQARSEGALLHAKTVRLAEREQRNVDTAVCVSRQAQTDADNILAQASALGARAADNVGALLAALESRIGSDLERTLALHIGTHTSKLRTELERVAETYRGESEPKTDSIRAALEAADALAAGVQSAVEAAANDVSSACTASAADAQTFHSQLNEQWITLATAVRQIVGPAQSDGEAALREAETRNDQHAQQIRGDSLEQQQRAAEHIAALEQQVEALQAKALQDDESTLHAFAQMLAQRREGSAAMSSAIIQRVAADVDARNSMTQSLIGRFDESAKGHTFAAKTLLAGTAAAHDAIIQRVAGCANAAKASVGALVRSTDDRCAHIQTRLAIALHAAADARAEAVAKHVVIRQEFGALGKAGESAMQLASTAATEAADRYYGTTELVVSAIGSARGEMGDLAETQTAEIKSAVAAISANIANVATTVQRGLAEGVQALESSGQTPTRLAAQRSPASWNVTLPHDTILARLPANEHADRLDWTGEPACWDEVVMADAESMTDVEPMDVARPATPDAAPRKRPSDSAISPHADVASQRPTRRPRTRAALDHSDSATVDENDPPAAALTPPAEPDLRLASAIPMPRRARRARN